MSEEKEGPLLTVEERQAYLRNKLGTPRKKKSEKQRLKKGLPLKKTTPKKHKINPDFLPDDLKHLAR